MAWEASVDAKIGMTASNIEGKHGRMIVQEGGEREAKQNSKKIVRVPVSHSRNRHRKVEHMAFIVVLR